MSPVVDAAAQAARWPPIIKAAGLKAQ